MRRSPLCPQCIRGKARRSHRRRHEWLTAPLGLRPWRCKDCGLRFWTPHWLARLLRR
jgi:hypothetical protein